MVLYNIIAHVTFALKSKNVFSDLPGHLPSCVNLL